MKPMKQNYEEQNGMKLADVDVCFIWYTIDEPESDFDEDQKVTFSFDNQADLDELYAFVKAATGVEITINTVMR